ncbi:MAG TPA: class I SAM-dependent methyltransferase [Candidatus Paceibacterota bacterium]|nr:class I SAM-dependent methyltransferase [Candidatus Paceibacterota bacterium]
MSFAKPLDNVLQMGLREGMQVGDIGTGSGHYALAAANIVGEAGHVYAFDIQEDVLARLRSDAKQRGVENIETVWGDIEKEHGTLVADRSLDAVILSNTLFQLEKKEVALQEVKRILKPKGKLLVVDWAGSYSGMGPKEEHVVPEQEAERMLIAAGFHKMKAFRGGPHHYALLFAAP